MPIVETKKYNFSPKPYSVFDFLLLLQCQSLIEELSASHSTDLQQRAYELQVVIGLDASAVKIIMPSDASCEDIEATLETKTTMKLHQCKVLGLRHMSFPYLRCHQGFLQFPLRRLRNLFQYLSHPSLSNADPSELRLRLDGVQKMWGRPTYSSYETSTSISSSQKTVNGISKVDATGTVNSKAHDNSYNSRKPHVEISLEKQKFAASLFGGSSKTEKRGSTVGHKTGKAERQADMLQRSLKRQKHRLKLQWRR
ncbi:hypothetical protein LWI28_000033 [Acer negundo]|uniref:Uncharacterized protein n=1 Tax=Acer negundo TaxID=4023 RepID=A0AAD5I6T9_ACENE|nr:hypothetical protein LWI28_000033 [Acer negundo]